MPRPICVACQVEFRAEKNGVVVHDPQVGRFPSTYWKADRYQCPCCGAQIVVGFCSRGREACEMPPGEAETSMEFRHNP